VRDLDLATIYLLGCSPMPPQIPGQTQMFSIWSQLATFLLAVFKIPLANVNFSAKTRTDPGNKNSQNRATKARSTVNLTRVYRASRQYMCIVANKKLFLLIAEM
jgi:hypothetical protein